MGETKPGMEYPKGKTSPIVLRDCIGLGNLLIQGIKETVQHSTQLALVCLILFLYLKTIREWKTPIEMISEARESVTFH